MSKPTIYLPEPGSLPARVLELFKRQPDEHFTSGDLALKFQVQAGKFKAALEAPVNKHLLVYGRSPDDPDGAQMWHAGPGFKDWLATQNSTPAPAPAPAATRGKRGGARNQLPPLDLSKLTIKTGVPKPPRTRFSRAGESKYSPLFSALKPGQSVDVPSQYMATLYTHAKKLKKAGSGSYTVQRTGIDTCTVWRDA